MPRKKKPTHKILHTDMADRPHAGSVHDAFIPEGVRPPSELENQFISYWRDEHPDLELFREYRFLADRRFRFDFANPETRVAIEVHGGRWLKQKGGHSSGGGIEEDCEKLCLAGFAGWVVFPIVDSQITPGFLHYPAQTIRERLFQLRLAESIEEQQQPEPRPEPQPEPEPEKSLLVLPRIGGSTKPGGKFRPLRNFSA